MSNTADFTELQNSVLGFEKRVKEIESKAQLIERSIDLKDSELAAQMEELEESMKTITSQIDELKKEAELIIKTMMKTVSKVQDVAASTDLDRVKNSVEEFRPEMWLKRREVERMVEEKIRK